MDRDARLRALLSLYRYYEYAEVMRYEWHRYFHMGTERRHSVDTPFPAPPDPKTCGLSAFSVHWFAALYPLVEGWQHLGLRDEAIDDLLQQAGYVKDLRRFRNVVYHLSTLKVRMVKRWKEQNCLPPAL